MTKIAIIAAGLLLVACSTSDTSGDDGEPETADELTARAAVVFDAYAQGDWGTVWDRVDAAGQDLISRDEYIRRLDACPQPPMAIQVVDATSEGGRWSVVLSANGMPVVMPAAHEQGRWVFPFTPDAAANMTRDFDSFVANC